MKRTLGKHKKNLRKEKVVWFELFFSPVRRFYFLVLLFAPPLVASIFLFPPSSLMVRLSFFCPNESKRTDTEPLLPPLPPPLWLTHLSAGSTSCLQVPLPVWNWTKTHLNTNKQTNSSLSAFTCNFLILSFSLVSNKHEIHEDSIRFMIFCQNSSTCERICLFYINPVEFLSVYELIHSLSLTLTDVNLSF